MAPKMTLSNKCPTIKLIASLKPKEIILDAKAKNSKKILKGTNAEGVPAGKKIANKQNLWEKKAKRKIPKMKVKLTDKVRNNSTVGVVE